MLCGKYNLKIGSVIKYKECANLCESLWGSICIVTGFNEKTGVVRIRRLQENDSKFYHIDSGFNSEKDVYEPVQL